MDTDNIESLSEQKVEENRLEENIRKLSKESKYTAFLSRLDEIADDTFSHCYHEDLEADFNNLNIKTKSRNEVVLPNSSIPVAQYFLQHYKSLIISSNTLRNFPSIHQVYEYPQENMVKFEDTTGQAYVNPEIVKNIIYSQLYEHIISPIFIANVSFKQFGFVANKNPIITREVVIIELNQQSIASNRNISSTYDLIGLDSIVYAKVEQKYHPFAIVEDIYGPTNRPFYLARLFSNFTKESIPSPCDIYYVENKNESIQNQLSKEKGCDASNFYDEELKNNDCFSDDEEESRHKKARGGGKDRSQEDQQGGKGYMKHYAKYVKPSQGFEDEKAYDQFSQSYINDKADSHSRKIKRIDDDEMVGLNKSQDSGLGSMSRDELGQNKMKSDEKPNEGQKKSGGILSIFKKYLFGD